MASRVSMKSLKTNTTRTEKITGNGITIDINFVHNFIIYYLLLKTLNLLGWGFFVVLWKKGVLLVGVPYYTLGYITPVKLLKQIGRPILKTFFS